MSNNDVKKIILRSETLFSLVQKRDLVFLIKIDEVNGMTDTKWISNFHHDFKIEKPFHEFK